ncbi:UTP--glucose-1-phosphate uridylyltransferase [hydrothermal vent metagenome]|uniref:UTP--glucose-1-phosphate uridylyltransferase n=1 Tax=hydrothermal vent metagenome TaxID=652676 RepID=A0A3B1BYF3_9ZZZZ
MKITKAVFPVAGLGTRFLPATKASPKEMLPLVDKPLIQYVVEEAVAAGIEQIIMVTGRNKTSIEDHFDNAYELESILKQKGQSELLKTSEGVTDLCDFVYIRQKEPNGLGHAIGRAKNIVGDEPFAVILGDDIIHCESRPGIGQLIDIFEEKGDPVIAVKQVPMEAVSSYGVIDPEPVGERLSRIKAMVEKPPMEEAPSNLSIVGRYVLTPDIFGFIENTKPDKKGEIQLTDALSAMLGARPMYACEFQGAHYDAGDKLGFLKATVEFALRRDDLGPGFRKYLKELKL